MGGATTEAAPEKTSGDDLNDIKNQLAALQDKLSKMSK